MSKDDLAGFYNRLMEAAILLGAGQPEAALTTINGILEDLEAIGG